MKTDSPTAAALVIGNEILSGKVAEANLVALARTLREVGISLRRVVIVRDEIDEIAEAIRDLSRSHSWVFTSGGVGPTHDDVTVEAAARAFGVPVVKNETLRAAIAHHYGERCLPGHLRMAEIPEGASLETGDDVTWPAIRLRNVWLLPGIPEAFRMKLRIVEQKLEPGARFISKAALVNLDEGELKPLLDAIVDRFHDVEVGSYPQWSDPTYRTKITFDGTDAVRVGAALEAFLAMLPSGEPQSIQ